MEGPDFDRRIAQLWDAIPASHGRTRAEHLLELSQHLMEADRLREALPVVETAEELFLEVHDHGSAGCAAHNRAVILGRLHRPDEAIGAERISIEAFLRDQRPDLAGGSRMSLAFQLRFSGRLKEALVEFRTATEEFEAGHCEPVHLAHALMAIIEIEIELGRYPAAAKVLRRAMALAAAAAPIPQVARLHDLAATVLEVRSGHHAAIKALRRARAVWEACDEDTHVAACDIRIATLSMHEGAPDEATTILKSLREERKDAGDVAGVAACDRGIGRAALERGRPHQALRRLEDAATVFHACGLFGAAAESDALAAQALAETGRKEEAVKLLRSALRGLRALHRPHAEAKALVLLAGLLLNTGDARAAQRAAARAQSIARRGQFHAELAGAEQLKRHAADRADASAMPLF